MADEYEVLLRLVALGVGGAACNDGRLPRPMWRWPYDLRQVASLLSMPR